MSAAVGGAAEQSINVAEEAEAAEVCYFLASVNRPGVTGQSAASAGGSMSDGGGGGGGGGRVRGKKGAAGEIGISGGDSWLTRAGWCKAERTLTLSLMDPGAPPDEGAALAHPDDALREPARQPVSAEGPIIAEIIRWTLVRSPAARARESVVPRTGYLLGVGLEIPHSAEASAQEEI